uniref:glycosyltransferase n=1 Tax=Ningiella ruwaisensis TaxID=2364274 RepID=UPI00109F2DF9|nr:glycosyltransferase [Ningiella ruwaisensis]
MTQSTKVSICVAQYNRADRIKSSIGSLLNQAFDDFEVIVVDDGSPDPAVQVELQKLSHERLTVVRQENTGFVGAMNHAIRLAKGEYIAIHGAGDISLPLRIKTQSEFLDKHSDVGLVSCLFDNVVMDGKYAGKRNSRPKPHVVTKDHLLAFDNPFSQGEVMFRKVLFDKVGGYREYFKYAQDRDLWLRMIDHTKMRIIQEKLYERGIFVTDGVAASIEKTMLQKYLASLARDCYEQKLSGKGDLVEKYDVHAAFYRSPDPLLAKYFARQAVETMLRDNMPDALVQANYAIRERKTVYSVLAVIVINICRVTIVRKIIQRGIVTIYPNSAKKHKLEDN